MEIPDWAGSDNLEAVGYARPHDISISREGSNDDAVLATISHLHIVGPIVHIELVRKDTNDYLEAEIPKEKYRRLALNAGEEVFIKPKQLKIFTPEDFII